jgi:hypothetical protein
MSDNYFVDRYRFDIHRNWKFRDFFGIKVDFAPAAQIPLSPMRSIDLPVDCAPLPAVPSNIGIFLLCEISKLFFAIEENEDVAFEDSKNVAKLVTIIFVWIGVAPQA